jgi:hypothetical protein
MDALRDPLPTAALTVVLLAALVIPGSSAWSGPVLLVLAPTHGVHLTDLGVVALALVVVVVVEAVRRRTEAAAAARAVGVERR